MPVTTYAYEYKELSDDAKERARDKVREWEREDTSVCEMITEDFKYYLEERGLPQDVNWSLSCCQGDGVSFHGKVDVQKFMDFYKLREWGPMEDLLFVEIKDVGTHYHHWNTMIVEHEYNNGEDETDHPMAWWISQHVDNLIEYIKATIVDVSHELEKRGYADLEYRDTDEYIEETINNNDWLFDEDGEFLPFATKQHRERTLKPKRKKKVKIPA